MASSSGLLEGPREGATASACGAVEGVCGSHGEKAEARPCEPQRNLSKMPTAHSGPPFRRPRGAERLRRSVWSVSLAPKPLLALAAGDGRVGRAVHCWAVPETRGPDLAGRRLPGADPEHRGPGCLKQNRVPSRPDSCQVHWRVPKARDGEPLTRSHGAQHAVHARAQAASPGSRQQSSVWGSTAHRPKSVQQDGQAPSARGSPIEGLAEGRPGDDPL